MFVKAKINPQTGLPFVIRQPERRYRLLPPDGADVPNNRFYRQHIKDGSLELDAELMAHIVTVSESGEQTETVVTAEEAVA